MHTRKPRRALLPDGACRASDRQRLMALLQESEARVGIGVISEREIDRVNVLQASLLAMKT